MHKVFQVVAWLLALTILVLSSVPPSMRPQTGAGSGLEHLLIFLAIGLASSLGYPRRPYVLILALLIFAAGVEIIQLGVPGRHARLSDLLVDSMASWLGLGLPYLAGGVRQYFRSRDQNR